MARSSLGWAVLLRFWASNQTANIGLVIGFGLVALVSAFAFFAMPFGQAVSTQGRIMKTVQAGSRYGSFLAATISVEGAKVWLPLDANVDCRAGDVIQLSRRRARWRANYQQALTPKPCSRPEPADVKISHRLLARMKR